MAGFPTGTVTFLFTDIEGSTRRWEEYPDAMKKGLAKHDALLHSAIEKNGGYVFKTIGDAFCAAFFTAPQALVSAVDAQRALYAEDWGDMPPLRVRMGIHSGAAEVRNGDYSGPTFDRTMGLLTAAHGGQTLLSLPAQELVRESLPPGISLLDMGERRLRDLLHKERLFQVLDPQLPSNFPPLRTLEGRTNNLPARTTLLVGRAREVKECRDLLRKPDVRLLTLTGPGGTGKTRLALHVAAELLDDFQDGVFAVSLATITDPNLVVPTIAETLGIREITGQPLLSSLKDWLRDKNVLLLLDNFEQVLGAAPVVWELLAAAPKAKVLVTSRSVLQLSAEYEYSVPPMSLPDHDNMPPLEELSQYDAVALFIARATAVKPDFVVTNENAPAVAEICYTLDGLPLAIELAAARVKILPPQALLARLTNRLNLLTGGARDMPARQQTMRATIDWSYSLLEPQEQALFRRFSVFVRGCTFDAAEAVVDPAMDLKLDILDGIASLVNNSMLRQVPGTEYEPRFSMLETLREYAQAKLAETGEASEIHARHAAYYTDLAEQAEPALLDAGQKYWLPRLEREHDNMRAALTWYIEQKDAVNGFRLAGALWRFWYIRGHISEGSRFLLDVLALPGGTERNKIRAKALNGAGNLVYNRGDYDLATQLHEESLSISRELGDRRAAAASLNNLGLIARGRGNYESARSYFEQGLTENRTEGNRSWQAINLNNLGTVLYDTGEFAEARKAEEESLRIFTALGDEWGMSMALSDLAKVVYEQGEYDLARSLYERSLSIQKQMGDRRNIADTLNKLGTVAHQQSDYPTAQRMFEQSLSAFKDLGDKRGIANSLHNLGKVAFRRGDLALARSNFEQSLAIRRGMDDKREIAQSLNNLGLVALATADYTLARQYMVESMALWLEVGNKALVPTALNNLGLVSICLGEFEEAQSYLRESLVLFEASGEKLGEGFAYLNMGLAVAGSGDFEPARGHYLRGLAVFNELGDKLHVATCMARLAALYAVMGQSERAVRLAGASQAILEALGSPLPSFERIYFEPALAGARAQIGKETAAKIAAEGASMTMEEVVEYAMQPDGEAVAAVASPQVEK